MIAKLTRLSESSKKDDERSEEEDKFAELKEHTRMIEAKLIAERTAREELSIHSAKVEKENDKLKKELNDDCLRRLHESHNGDTETINILRKANALLESVRRVKAVADNRL